MKTKPKRFFLINTLYRSLPYRKNQIFCTITDTKTAQASIRFNQVEFKTPKHGEIDGLDVNEEGKVDNTDFVLLMQNYIDNSVEV